MCRQALFFVFLLLSGLSLLSERAFSATAALPPYCQNAQSTADLMKCTKDRYDEVQTSLQGTYDSLLASYDDTQTQWADTLVQTQSDWIAYRDKVCAWYIDQAETESLKRLQELNCVITASDSRLKLLKNILESKDHDKTENQPKIALPLWMNVLASDYPKTYWRYADHLNFDLNCDGEKEEIVAGVNMIQNEHADQQSALMSDAVLAVIETPLTGRPETKIIHWDLKKPIVGSQEKEQKTRGCDPNLEIKKIFQPVANEAAYEAIVDHTKKDQCLYALEVKSSGCKAEFLIWDGSAYVWRTEN